MLTTYKVSGMHCQACQVKVQKALSGINGVTAAEVSLSNATAKVTSKNALLMSDLEAATAALGSYKISPLASVDSGEVCGIPVKATSGGTWWHTYKPLLTIAAFIVGSTLVIAQSTKNWQLMSLMNSFMGLFFVVFAFFKILDVSGFARAYRSYDVIAKRWPTYGLIYPWIELSLGVSFLLDFWPLAINLITLVIMSVSTIGVVNAVVRKQEIPCGCLGTVFQLPMSTVTIVEDTLMVAMAASSLAMLA